MDYITTLGNAFVHNVTFLMPEDVVGVTDRIYYHKCSDKEKHEYHVCRGVEIEHYLYEHPEIKNYVILDDDSDMLLSQRKHFVKTHTRGGIYITFNSSDNIKKNDLFEIKLYDKYYYFEAESIKVIGKLLEVQATETGYWANKLSNLKQDIDLRDVIDVEVFPIKDEKKNSAN